jgi:hypothetical protein
MLYRWRAFSSAEMQCDARVTKNGMYEKVGLSQKEESDLTERWIFGIPTSTDCICSSTVALYISVKI